MNPLCSVESFGNSCCQLVQRRRYIPISLNPNYLYPQPARIFHKASQEILEAYLSLYAIGQLSLHTCTMCMCDQMPDIFAYPVDLDMYRCGGFRGSTTGCLAVGVTTLILNNFLISGPIIKPFNSMKVKTIRICLVYKTPCKVQFFLIL